MANPFRFSRLMETAGRFSPTKVLSFIIHLPNFIRLFSRLLADSRVPFHLKLICYGSIIYLIFPFDFLPDLPFFQIGYIDDILFIVFAFRKLIKDCPPEIIRDHVEAISRGER